MWPVAGVLVTSIAASGDGIELAQEFRQSGPPRQVGCTARCVAAIVPGALSPIRNAETIFRSHACEQENCGCKRRIEAGI